MSLPWSDKEEKAVGADLDEVLILDSEDTDPATINKRLKLENIPSVANAVSDGNNLGTTGAQVFSSKVGTILNFRRLLGETDKIVLNQDTNDITFTVGGNVVTTDKTNTYGAGLRQSFIADADDAGININDQVPTGLIGGDLFRDGDAFQYADSTVIPAIREIVDLSLFQVLLNKTINADDNSISNLALGDEVTGASSDLTDGSNIALLNTLNNFTAGTQSLFFVTENGAPATDGQYRLGNSDTIAWLDNSGFNNLFLAVNSDDLLLFDTTFIAATSSQGSLNQVLSSNGPGINPSFKDITDTVFPVPDDIFEIVGNADPTKKMVFEVDGITSGFTSTITIPDASIELVNTSNGFITDSNLTAGSFTSITGVGTLSVGTWNADTITVPFGGTGATTLTSGGVLFGAGTSAITSNDVQTGEILFGNGGVATIDAMSGDAIIDNAGAVTVLIASTALTDTANLARVSTTNTFGGFDQKFTGNTILIENTTSNFSYRIVPSAILAERSVTLPLLTGADTFVMEGFSQPLTNKTFDAASQTSVTNIAETMQTVITGAADTVLTSQGTGMTPSYQPTLSTISSTTTFVTMDTVISAGTTEFTELEVTLSNVTNGQAIISLFLFAEVASNNTTATLRVEDATAVDYFVKGLDFMTSGDLRYINYTFTHPTDGSTLKVFVDFSAQSWTVKGDTGGLEGSNTYMSVVEITN